MLSGGLRRFVSAMVALFVLSALVFAVVHLAPGDPVELLLPMEATPQDAAVLRRALGLDRPLPVQFGLFVVRVLQGDLGRSITHKEWVSTVLLGRLPATLELTVCSILLATVIGVPLGVLAAARKDTPLDHAISSASMLGLSLPNFWMGILLILIFSVSLRWLPAFGRSPHSLGEGVIALLGGDPGPLVDAFRHLALPAATLAVYFLAIFVRYSRSSIIEEQARDYVRTARAKGFSEGAITARHVLRNALIPIVTVLGVQTGRLIGGAVVAETVFAWPGVGRLLLEAILARDYPLIQGGVLAIGVLNGLLFLGLDVLYLAIDPRLRR